jgi:hypothetical protein
MAVRPDLAVARCDDRFQPGQRLVVGRFGGLLQRSWHPVGQHE